MKVPLLVVGAAGQLGQEILALAVEQKRAVIGLTRADLDIADASTVAAAIAYAKPRMIINVAAYTAVDKAETNEDAAYSANVTGPANLAKAAVCADAPLVHISTDYVFDGTKAEPYIETDAIAPLGVYGRTKALGEAAVRETAMRHVILRTAWVYGIYGSNFLKTMLRLARTSDKLRVVGDQIGCPTATRDIAEALFAIADAQNPRWGTYHFGGTGDASWHGFAEAIVAAAAPVLGRRPGVDEITTAEYPTPAQRPANSRLDSRLFTATFGLKSKPWTEQTKDVVATLLKQKDQT